MKDVFKEIVTRRLSGAPDSTAKTELIEELTENLNCRYEDMVQAGTEPEEAKNLAVDALGDTNELVEYLKGLEPDQSLPELVLDADKPDGGQIDEIIRNVEAILRGALKKAKGTLQEAKDKVRDGVKGGTEVHVHVSSDSETETAMQEIEEAMNRKAEELDAAREALEELENARDALEDVSDRAIVEQALADIEVKIGAKAAEISALEDEYAALEDEYAALEDEYAALEDDLDDDDDDDDDDELDDLDDELTDLDAELADLDDELADLDDENGWKFTYHHKGGRSVEITSEELKASVKDVMAEIKDAVCGAADLTKDVYESAKNAAEQAYKDMADACTPDTMVKADEPIDGAELCAIDVQSYNGNITVRMSQPEDGDVLVGGDIGSFDVFRSKDGVLTIRPIRTETFAFFSGRGMSGGGSAEAVVLDLPCRQWKNLKLSSTYGDIHLEGESADRVSITNVCGDISGKLSTCAALMCRSTNGDISWAGDASDLRLESVSGDVTFRGNADSVAAKTTSGDLTLEGAVCAATAKSIAGDVILRSNVLPDRLEAATTSGDMEVSIPDAGGFTAQFRTISGRFTSDFFTGKMGGRNCVFNYQGGGKRVYTFASVSGDVTLEKNKRG